MTDSSSSRGSVSSPSTSPTPQAFYNIADEFVSRLAREHPEKLAILGTRRALTYAELEALVARVAEALRSANCQPGERVLIALPDSAELVAAFFGAAKIGAIAVPVNPMARAADYRHWLENCGARIAIVHAPILGEFGDGVAGDAALDFLVIYESTAGTVKPERVARKIFEWDDWVPSRAGAVRTHPTVATDAAFFLYTSGSGGAPKAVVHRHQDMGIAARNYAQGVLGLRADDRLFSASKLFFAYGLGNGMYFPLHFGAGTILYPEKPRADDIAAVIAEHRPTVFFSVPTFYASLLREAEKGLMLDFFLSSRRGEARAGSCGREVPGYEARILRDAGEPARVDEAGNLWVKGESAFAEYWRIPELTARTKRDGWVNTGDKFSRDAEGYFYYRGRADDMMKVSGMWVSPGEVENALLGHAAIAECAVVGSADGVGLVRPVAYIVLRQSATNTAGGLDSEIYGWLRTRLPGFKCPQEYRFVKELPRTATGKVQRFLLRALGGESKVAR